MQVADIRTYREVLEDETRNKGQGEKAAKRAAAKAAHEVCQSDAYKPGPGEQIPQGDPGFKPRVVSPEPEPSEDPQQAITQKLPILVIPEEKPAEPEKKAERKQSAPSQAAPSFCLIDRDPELEQEIAQRRAKTVELIRKELGPDWEPPAAEPTEENLPDIIPEYRSYNPYVHELLSFWAENGFFQLGDLTMVYATMVPYYNRIHISEETMQPLYNILDDDDAVEQLLESEREYWKSLTEKQEKPWLQLYNGESYHPLSRTETEDAYPPAVVKAILLLLFLFRQVYALPWSTRIIARILNYAFQK